MIGTMAHEITRSWIIIEMLGKATALGSLQLAIAIPSILLILHAGVIVDRSNVRVIMMVTKGVLAVAALVMTVIVGTGHIQFWHLLIFGLIEGCVTAFDSPAFQALTVRLVPRGDFQQALALNSLNFHGARMLGPLVAGVLMSWVGPASVFLFDGLTYLVLIAILSRLSLAEAQFAPFKEPPLSALWDGLSYMARAPLIRYRILQLMVAIMFIYPILSVVMRTYLQRKFQMSAAEFGYVFTVPAIGAMLGALTFAVMKPNQPLRALMIGIPGAIMSLLIQPLMGSVQSSALLLGLSGYLTYLSFAALSVSLQLEVDEQYRGRLGSVIGLSFMGIGPMMGFPIGVMADHLGEEVALVICCGICVLLSTLLYLAHKTALHGALTPSLSRNLELEAS